MLIGRGALLAGIHEASGRDRGVFDLRGRLGSGKTAIVHHLDRAVQDFRPIRVDMEDFNPGHDGEAGPSASVGAVQASFQQLSRLLVDLVKRASPARAEAFEHEVAEAYNSEVAGRRVFSIEQAMAETQGQLSPRDLADAWRASAGDVVSRFLRVWNDVDDGKCRLLLLDNVDEIANQELGAWLGDLLAQVDRTVVVLTRQPDGPFLSFPDDVREGFVAVDVPNFDEDDVEEYLNEKAPRRVSREVAKRVHRITEGHPGTVAVVHDLLWGWGLGEEAPPTAVLPDLAPQSTETVALLVERLVERRNDPAMLRALGAAAVPRRLDAVLLKALLAEDGGADDDVKRVFDAFGGFPFVEDLTPSNRLPARSVIRIHPYVRNGLLDRMVRLERDRFDVLHERAANYHRDLLLGKDASGASFAYGEAFVYEDPEWQRCKREWLYHRGHARNEDARRAAALEFARVFLEAFWWWGNYVHFDFCDQLVTDLGHMAGGHGRPGDASTWASLGVLHEAVQSFHQAYPPRSGKRKDADWGQVYDALLQIQDVCGITDRGPRRSDEERKVGALLDVFLAHTWRYRTPQNPKTQLKADEYYRRAVAGFKEVEEEWSEAWVHFERAELRLEGDQGDDELHELWCQATTIVQPRSDGHDDDHADKDDASEEPDEELTANLHRLRGDVCWAHGDHRRAAAWYRRAVLHAYLFHNIGGPPDEYTLQFYVDIRARALNRLVDLWDNGRRAEALEWADELARVRTDTSFDEEAPPRADLVAALDGGRRLALALALFPRGPEVSDLRMKASKFLIEFLRRREALDKDAVAVDLHDPEWP